MKIRMFAAACVAALGLAVCFAFAAPADLSAGLTALIHAPGTLDSALAMMVAPTLNLRARGLVVARAEGGGANAVEVLNELKKTFEDFKAEHEKQLKGIDQKFADVVQTEKVDRINATITELQTSLDQINESIAAIETGAGGANPTDPAKAAHKAGFRNYFRRGVEDGLRELEVKAAATTDSDPDGGYVVDDEIETEIDRVLGVVSAMRSIARTMSISRGTYKKLVGQGGATGGWVSEKEARPQTNTPTLAELAFEAMELYANPAATQTLLDDSRVDIASWLGEEVSITFAEMEGAAFISGTGFGQPRGILSYENVADASYAWGKLGFIATGVAADINDTTHNGVDSLLDLVYAIKQGYRPNARFLMNRTLASKYRKLKDSDGNYMWQPPVQAGQPATLVGYPITDDDNMPNVGANATPVAFGDFRRGYLIVDRIGVRVLRDPYTNKPYVHFYTTKRVGGGVQNFEAIKLIKCAA